jgi:chromate transporter
MKELLFGPLGIGTDGLWQMFVHFGLLSLLAVGGAITTAPDMQRWIVGRQGWLSDAEFSGSVALAQAAPGPNLLFVAVIGFNVAGLAGAAVAMLGSLIPSASLALAAARWGRQRQEQRAVRAFTEGMAPVTIGLLVSTAWVLTEPTRTSWPAWALFGATLAFMHFVKSNPLWMIAAGAICGVLGWV